MKTNHLKHKILSNNLVFALVIKTIYFSIGLLCLLGGLGCKPTKEPKLQLSKEIDVYNKEVREKHLEPILDSALWQAYTTRILQHTKIKFKDVLGVEKEVLVHFYECKLDSSRIKIKRNEKSKYTAFELDFRHISFEMFGISWYRLLYPKGCDWSGLWFCPLVSISVYDSGLIGHGFIIECSMLGWTRYNEDMVCELFENPEAVRRMTPWLRREGVRRGYLSTDNW
jgi:hypothetical protein